MQKNIAIILGLVLALSLVIPTVLATSSMSSPTTGSNHTGTMTVTVLYDGYNDVNMTNVTCHYNSTGGTAELGSVLVEILNSSVSTTTFTSSVNIASFTDLLTYNVSCRMYNCSSDGCTLNSTFYASSIGVDNTDPTYTFELSKPSRADYKGTQYLSWTTADATTGVNTVSVTVTSPNTDTCPTQSWTTTSGTQQSILLDCTGIYTAAMTVTDIVGNSVSTSDPFTVYAPGYKTSTGAGGSFGTFSIGGDAEGKANLKTIAIIAVIILLIYLVTKKK